jgi:hypothetical protein
MNMDEHSTTLYWAAGASYDPSGSPLPDGYSLDPDFGQGGVFEDNDTDFRVIALKNNQGDYILAFAGTEGLADAFADIQLGWNQWKENRGIIRDYIADVRRDESDATFHFTGHSLGGALAQYAAYDYVQRSQQAGKTTPEISLITFNGLSAVAGLTLYGGNYAPAVFAGIDSVRHYFVEGDFVSQLGGGHLGGNTYRIDNLLSDAPLNFLDGHFMSTIEAMTPEGFGMAEPAGIDYVNFTVLQPLAAGIASLLNDKDVTELEAGARVVAGVMGAISNYLMLSITPGTGVPSGELDKLVNVLFTNLAEAENGSLKGKALQAIADLPWERLTRNKSLEAGAISVIALLTGVMSDLYETTVDLAKLLPKPEWLEQISQTTQLLNDFINANASSNVDTLRAWFGDLAEPVLAALGLNTAQPEANLSQLQLSEGGDGTLTLTLEETTDSTGQAYVVTVYDPDLITLSGDGVYLRDAAAGEYLVIVKPDTNQTTIQVHAEMDLNNYDDDVLLQITGTPFSDLDDSLMDQPLGYGTIEVMDTDTPAEQTLTISGDLRWQDFDLDEPGIQTRNDALGNKILDPGQIAVPDQDDELYDSTGNDLIQSGGGEDVISAWRGGDDHIQAGSGRDKVYAGDGDDLIEGGADTDILAGIDSLAEAA